MWIKNLTLTMGLVDTTSIPTLLTMAVGRIPAEKMGTHTFALDEIEQAYEVSGTRRPRGTQGRDHYRVMWSATSRQIATECCGGPHG